MDAVELGDALWRGEARIEDHHPLFAVGEVTRVADGVAFVPSFANVGAIETGDGLVLLDASSAMFADHVVRQLRSWSKARVARIVFTHGHIDHVGGASSFDAEAAERGEGAIHVVAHEGVSSRFERYVRTAGYNAVINRRQFGIDDLVWPTEYRYPDETYRDVLQFDVGGESVELRHAQGETDDHTYVWFPQRRVLGCGDLFIWACPNAGNPQKVQRYPSEWAMALRDMSKLGAQVMLPGHGFPIVGEERIADGLTSAAELLESVHDQTVAMMNEGASLDDALHAVRVPEHLLEKPYLRPIYDEPEFIVRNVWRLYGGWFDGDPASLKPAPIAELARELAELAGGVTRLAERAVRLLDAGEYRLASHLAELAFRAAPRDPGVRDVRRRVYEERAIAETSTMAKGIFNAAARDSSDPAP